MITKKQKNPTPTGVRTYQIILRSGAKIEFRAAWNTQNPNLPYPPTFIAHWEKFKSSGQLADAPSGYRFPISNDSQDDAAILNIDLREIVAIVQIIQIV